MRKNKFLVEYKTFLIEKATESLKLGKREMFKLEKGQDKEVKTMKDDIWEFNPVSIHLIQAQCVCHVKCL